VAGRLGGDSSGDARLPTAKHNGGRLKESFAYVCREGRELVVSGEIAVTP